MTTRWGKQVCHLFGSKGGKMQKSGRKSSCYATKHRTKSKQG
jgi:hypothetical protein